MTEQLLKIEEIKHELRKANSNIDKLQTRLQANFNYEINWVMKDLFMANEKKKHHTQTLTMIDKLDGDVDFAIANMIKYHTNFISESYNLRKNSTCEVTNMTSTWEFEIKMDLIKFYKNI